jgi:dUTP pyrophosphatase
LDLHALSTHKLKPGESAKVSTGLAFIIPEGYEVQIRPRSGLSMKTSLRVSNAPGTVDQDFQGEVCVLIDNISRTDSFIISKGDRIAQAVLCPVELCDVEEVKELGDKTERGTGGFGSTKLK